MKESPFVFCGVPAVVEQRTPTAGDLIRTGKETESRWRYRLDQFQWQKVAERLQTDPCEFMGLWCDNEAVHLLLNDGPLAVAGLKPLMASYTLEGPRYPGVSASRPSAAPFERMIRDLQGAEAMDASDTRPLVDHGWWAQTTPLASRPGPPPAEPDLPEFRPLSADVRQKGMTLGYGPARGSGEGPLHFHLGVAGDVIRSAESLSGFAHRGVMARMTGNTLSASHRLAGRIGAGSSVAHQWAFSAAVEHAAGLAVSSLATWCRILFAEIERVLTHLLVIGRIARTAENDLLATRIYRIREEGLQICCAMSGHRMLMDLVCPGGVHLLHNPDEADVHLKLLASHAVRFAETVRSGMREVRSLWDAVPGYRYRLEKTGTLSAESCRQLDLMGLTGRAAGYGTDIRLHSDAYTDIPLRPVLLKDGDIATRCKARAEEIRESLKIIGNIAVRLEATEGDEAGELCVAVPRHSDRSEGIAVVEGPHGPVWFTVVLREDRTEHCYLSDPASRLLMAAEQVLPGCSPDDFDLIRCSFGVSVSAADL